MDLDPVLFSGLERQLIAYIICDFDNRRLSKFFNNPRTSGYIYDWYSSYSGIAELVRASGAVIRCGILPGKESASTLMQDFCEKSGIALRDGIREESAKVFNTSFNPDVVEAINNAVVMGLEMPGPHESNELLGLISYKMGAASADSSAFLASLKSYIDTFFLQSNYQLCHEYGLRESYFAPSAEYSKPEILELIVDENKRRLAEKSIIIDNYRALSAKLIELCLALAKGN
jgi:hypothetical protein